MSAHSFAAPLAFNYGKKIFITRQNPMRKYFLEIQILFSSRMQKPPQSGGGCDNGICLEILIVSGEKSGKKMKKVQGFLRQKSSRLSLTGVIDWKMSIECAISKVICYISCRISFPSESLITIAYPSRLLVNTRVSILNAMLLLPLDETNVVAKRN